MGGVTKSLRGEEPGDFDTVEICHLEQVPLAVWVPVLIICKARELDEVIPKALPVDLSF